MDVNKSKHIITNILKNVDVVKSYVTVSFEHILPALVALSAYSRVRSHTSTEGAHILHGRVVRL